MAAFAGLLNRSMTTGQALQGQNASPATAPGAGIQAASTSTSSGSTSATISANDFLTLLVTEMQNQDPTAETDPNEYINQLVQVNSLEQLIDINQNLTTALGNTTTSTDTAAGMSTTGISKGAQAARTASSLTAPPPAADSRPHASGSPVSGAKNTAPSNASGTVAAISRFAQSVGKPSASGNLGIPAGNPAAHRVAHALDGKPHRPAPPGKPAKAT